MATKRLYVAVGSVGVKCLMELIGRYQEEGFYKDTRDMFIGLDTDSGRVKELESLDSTNAHIVGIQVVHEAENSPVRDLIGDFRTDWDKKARIPQSGVGGDRKLSFSSLKWTQHVELQKRVSALTTGDELILIGTAFGGTATGMFWNVAMWLRAKLLLDKNQHRAEFYAFVVLPKDQGGDLEKYPWSYNLCAFMQDMQALDVSQRIQRCFQGNIPFRMPLFPLFESASSRELLPLWSEERYGASDHCFLPCDRVFVVPTPDTDIGAEAFIPDIVAEQAFVLGVLNGWQDFRVTSQTIDLMKASHGADYTKPDGAFGGFNMVAGRSARRMALSSVFWKKFKDQYKLFASSSGIKAASPETTRSLMTKALEHILDRDRVLALVEPRLDRFVQILDNHRLSSTEMAGYLDGVLKDVQSTLASQQYTWVSFAEFVQLCAEWVKPILRENPDTFITLSDFCEIYTVLRNEIQKEAAQFEDVRQRLLWLPSEQNRIAQSRLDTLPTKMLGASQAVVSEVQAEFKRAELTYLQWFVNCCRAKATLNQLKNSDDAAIAAELKDLAQKYDQRFDKLFTAALSRSKQEKLPACIYQDNERLVDVSDTLTVERGVYLNILLGCVTSAVADIQEKIARGERECVVALSEQAVARGPGNPLKRIQLDFSSGQPPVAFSDVFKLEDANQWHCHFFFKCGNVVPITWGKLESMSSVFQTFRRMLQGTPYAEGQNIDPTALVGNHYFSKAVNDGESQGAWIGTLQLDADIRTILYNTYERTGKNINIWESKAYAAVKDGAPQRSLLTLPELLALSVIIGCIDDCAKREKGLGAKGCELRIGNIRLPLITANDVSLFFNHAGEGTCRMVNIHREWIAPLMNWIDKSFWDDMEMREFHQRLIEMERSVLSKMTLTISNDELRKPLIDLANRVKGMIHVTLC